MNLKKIIAYINAITTLMDVFPVRLLLLENSILWRKYHTFRNLDYIPIWNYNQASKDLRYVLKLKDYDELPNYPKNLYPKLEEAYFNLLDQFMECVNSSEAMYTEELSSEIEILKCKYQVINTWIRLAYLDIERREYHIKEIEKYGYNIDRENLETSLEAAHNKNKLVLNKIGIKTNDYLELKKMSNNKKQTFDEVFAIVQRGLGIKLDAKKLSAKEWVVIQNDYINSFPKKNKNNASN